jgi:CheY-like chemotaxis protein
MQKILIVDDDPHALGALEYIAKHLYPEAKVHTSDGGQKGFALYQKVQPDLVITDLVMIGEEADSGIHLIKRIREKDKKTPIVVYSGFAFEAMRDEALAAGANIVITKPVITKILEATLAKYLPK